MPMMDISKRELETLRQLIAEHDRKLAADDADIEPIELSPREQEIFILIASGYEGAEIAARCTIAHQTVKTHLSNIFDKLQADNARHAVAKGLQLGLLHVEDIVPR